MGSFGNPSGTVVTNTGTITLGGNVTVNILGTNFSTGTISLLRYANRGGGGSFVLGSLPPNILAATITDDTVGKELRLNITSVVVPPDLTIAYVGDANGAWDVGNLANQIWVELLTSQATNFYSGAPVRFDDSATGTTDINLTTSLTPASVVVSNVTKTYKYYGAGDLTGATSLTKQGSGTLVISNANTYAGQTRIQAGTVRIESEVGAIGAGGVTNNGALVIDKTAVTTLPNQFNFNGQITGTGGLTFLGLDETNSTLELEIATPDGNPYSGGTTISNGFVRLNANPVTDSTRSAAKSTGLGSGTVNFLGASTVELEDYGIGNNSAQSGTFAPSLNVPASQAGSLRTGGRMTVSSALTGGGTFNLVVSYIRCVISGNFSAFTGQMNVGPSPNLTGNQYQIGNPAGLPLAKVRLMTGVTMGGNTPLGTGSLVPIGELSMDAGSFVNTVGENPNTAIFAVGGLNTSSSLAGNLGGPHSWVKVGTGTLTLSGTNDYTGNTTVSNGVMALIGETGMSNSPTLSVASPGVLDVSGRTDGTLWLGTDTNSQTLQGDGTIRGSVTVGSLGTVSPGFSIGTLTITNALTLGGTVSMELNRTNGSATNDMLVAQAIAGGGTLRVTNVGPALVAGDSFKLFNLGVSGFATVELPVTDSTGTTYTWNNTLAANGTITVATATGAVNPNPTNITFSVSGGSLNLSWPGDHQGWTLQTNAVSLMQTNAWFAYPGSSSVTNVTIPISRSKSNVFFRLVYP
jgi:autotransporter-associated beta strand protein